MAEKMTGIRLNEEMTYKIRYIAKKNHRKINDEFRLLLEKYIHAYETENGKIPLEIIPEGEKPTMRKRQVSRNITPFHLIHPESHILQA